MTLTLDQLRAKVEPLYPEVQQIGDTVLRYIRKTEQLPFAVYYLDVGDDLPQTPDNLNDYLNRVVGKRYFEGSSSLQWNNYLYFILSPNRLQDAATLKAKEMVELDRVYARKFVITESELDTVLRPKALTAASIDKAVDAISPWISILQEANLVEAVLGEHTLPERMELIERPPTVTSSPTISAKLAPNTLLPPIRQFEIKEFSRQLLIQREFHFGAVNLLFGANGSGKTSLLEAIELFYCGKTRRNPNVPEHYRFDVLANGKSQSVSHRRGLQSLRDRNLAWYGVREERSTKLYDGFGKFNFLNSDAAIELSQSTDNIDNDLAKLLVGSDASKTWQVIQKLDERVGTELRGLHSLRQQVKQELKLLNKQLAEISTVKKESDSYRSALRESLHRNQWMIEDDLASETDKLIAELAELKAASERVGDLYWLDAPVTFEIIESYSQAVESIIQERAPDLEKLETLMANQQQLTAAGRRDYDAMPLIDELARLIKSEIEQRTSELEKQREIITSYKSLVAGIDEEALRIVADADGNLSTRDYQESAVAARVRGEGVILEAKREYGDFAKLRDHSLSLAQELREVAARILKEMPSDECPLCHTNFKPGELARHIATGVDEHLEAKARKLLENVRRADETVVIAVANEKAANMFSSLCVRMELPPETELKDSIAGLNKAKDAQAKASKRAEILVSEIRAMEEQGLSLSRLNEVTARLNELGINVVDRSQVKVSSLKSDVDQRLTVSRRKIEANSKEEQQLKELLSQAVSAVRPSKADPIAAMAELNERLAATRAVSTALKRFLPRFSWKGSRPIVEWIVEVESVRGIAAQLQAALEKERVAAKTQTDASDRRDLLKEQENIRTGRTNRLDEAKEALAEIQTKHSLETMTKSALEANRGSIETIFSEIHSPAEFKEIGPDWTLIRKLDNAKTPLTMISTGQRAAFALAVFLAQNAKLQAGPQVILFDDPIAHIDDLNCLSFLDYLREIALTDTRQIFFATASSKLANLFERKFDFLGDKFRRFNLAR